MSRTERLQKLLQLLWFLGCILGLACCAARSLIHEYVQHVESTLLAATGALYVTMSAQYPHILLFPTQPNITVSQQSLRITTGSIL